MHKGGMLHFGKRVFHKFPVHQLDGFGLHPVPHSILGGLACSCSGWRAPGHGLGSCASPWLVLKRWREVPSSGRPDSHGHDLGRLLPPVGDVKVCAVPVEVLVEIPELYRPHDRGVHVNRLDTWSPRIEPEQVSPPTTLGHHIVDRDVIRMYPRGSRHGIDEGRAHPVDIVVELPERGIEGDNGLDLLVVRALESRVAQAVDARVAARAGGRVQRADVLGRGRAAVEVGVTERAIGGPAHEERVGTWLTQEAIGQLCGAWGVPVSAGSALDGRDSLHGTVAPGGADRAIRLRPSACGAPV